MQYLKIFEEYSSNNLYQRISFYDYDAYTLGEKEDEIEDFGQPIRNIRHDKFRKENWLPFNKLEIEIIKKFFEQELPGIMEIVIDNNNKFFVLEKLTRDANHIKTKHQRIGDKHRSFDNRILDIVKLPDEWYYVDADYGDTDKYYPDSCYRCDQLEGLMQCLKRELKK